MTPPHIKKITRVDNYYLSWFQTWHSIGKWWIRWEGCWRRMWSHASPECMTMTCLFISLTYFFVVSGVIVNGCHVGGALPCKTSEVHPKILKLERGKKGLAVFIFIFLKNVYVSSQPDRKMCGLVLIDLYFRYKVARPLYIDLLEWSNNK
jgi:hypothetical protein